MKNVIKSSVIVALVAMASQASAQSVLLNFDYIAQANTSATLSPGSSVSSLGGQSPGWLKVTDLADLNLGDGKTGVRIEAKLQNLAQFGNYSSNTLEFNFLGTGGARPTGASSTVPTEWITVGNSYRNISNNYALTGSTAEGTIEWNEGGRVGNGTRDTPNSHVWSSFQQQVNVTLGTWENNETIVFDFLNGDTLLAGPNAGQLYNGFSVASFLGSPVTNQGNAYATQTNTPLQPDAYVWLRLQPTAGPSGAPTDTAAWYNPYMSTATTTTVVNGISTVSPAASYGRLNFLATSVTAVPEAETYAMMMAGLALIGTIVRRRKSA